MSTVQTTWLGIAFGVLGLFAAGLQAWLWRFPMAPDPTGRDPNGVSTAPRFWTNVHRIAGYLFAADYLLLMAVMVPRLWRFQVLPASALIHAGLGLAIGVVLVFKILIIRVFRRLGGKLPWFGGFLALSAVVMLSLTVPSAYRAQNLSAAIAPVPLESVRRLDPRLATPEGMAAGREVVTTRCVSCHGSNVIMSKGRTPEGWRETADEMRERAERRGVPLSRTEAIRAAAYLAAIRPGLDGGPDDDEGGRRRGRGRGRGGRGRDD